MKWIYCSINTVYELITTKLARIHVASLDLPAARWVLHLQVKHRNALEWEAAGPYKSRQGLPLTPCPWVSHFKNSERKIRRSDIHSETLCAASVWDSDGLTVAEQSYILLTAATVLHSALEEKASILYAAVGSPTYSKACTKACGELSTTWCNNLPMLFLPMNAYDLRSGNHIPGSKAVWATHMQKSIHAQYYLQCLHNLEVQGVWEATKRQHTGKPWRRLFVSLLPLAKTPWR